MEETAYRTSLHETTSILGDFGQQLFTNLINLAMSGEMKEFDKGFDVGETLAYNDADFRHLEDQNVKLIYEVLDIIHKARGKLINISNLDCKANERDVNL